MRGWSVPSVLPAGAVALLLACAAAVPARARDCPSRMQAHTYDVTDWLALGAELRLFYLGMRVGEGLPLSDVMQGEFDNNFLSGLRGTGSLYPLPGLAFTLEAELRYRRPGWEERPVPGLDFRVWQAFADWEARPVELIAGLQFFSFGYGAVLDDRFAGLSAIYKNPMFDLTLMGGATGQMLRRSGTNCLWVRYTSATEGWKVVSNDLRENQAAGAIFSFKGLRPWRSQLLYLYSRASLPELGSHVVALGLGGPLKRRVASLELEPLLFVGHAGTLLPGVVGQLRVHVPFPGPAPRLAVGGAVSFLHGEERRLSPAWENLSWGLLKRYSLHDGAVGMVRFDWEVSRYAAPFAHYYIQQLKPGHAEDEPLHYLTDELDAGVAFRLGGLCSLTASFVGLNMAGRHEASPGAYLEARIVFGAE